MTMESAIVVIEAALQTAAVNLAIFLVARLILGIGQPAAYDIMFVTGSE